MSENKISITSNNSYAQALFELANEDNSLTKVEEQVVAISRLINESEEFRYLIKNPTTSIEDLTKVIETISEKNNFDNHQDNIKAAQELSAKVTELENK